MAAPMTDAAPEKGRQPGTPRGRLRSLIWAGIPLALFLALAAVFLKQLASGDNSHDLPSALIGKPAPQFTLAPLEGLLGPDGPTPGLSTATLAGKVSIVNVWASWCVPCRAEHPALVALSADKRVQLVGINYKDNTGNALRFLGQLGNPFAAVGVDPRGSAAIDWGVYGVPETFIVAADGTIAFKHVGPLTEQSLKARFLPALEAAIGKSGPAAQPVAGAAVQ